MVYTVLDIIFTFDEYNQHNILALCNIPVSLTILIVRHPQFITVVGCYDPSCLKCPVTEKKSVIACSQPLGFIKIICSTKTQLRSREE